MQEQSFGQLMRQLREQRGMTLPQLADWIHYSRGYLWEIERGRKLPGPDVVAAVDRALQAGGMLEAAVRAGGEAVQRRAVLHHLGMIGLAAPLAAAETVRHGLGEILAGETSTDADADEWQEIAAEYGHSFYATAPDRLLRDLMADLAVLEDRIVGVPTSRRPSLYRAAGQLAAISAMAWASVGEARHARRWWRTARQAADASGDAETRVWVRGWEVANGLYEQRPASVILDRAAEAAAIAERIVCAGAAGLYAGMAQTLAVAGRADEAVAALRRVAELTDQLPARVVADEDSMFGWPEVRLRHTESYVYTVLGQTSRAYAAQARALELYPASLARERAAMLLHRATCMVHDGDVDGGLDYAAQVLEDLPAEHRTELVHAVARRTLAAVPAEERAHSAAVELAGRLALPSGRPE